MTTQQSAATVCRTGTSVGTTVISNHARHRPVQDALGKTADGGRCRAAQDRSGRSRLGVAVEGALVPSNSDAAAPARSTAPSSMLSPPASIEPITDNAFGPLFAP